MPSRRIAHFVRWVVIACVGSWQAASAQSAPPVVWARAVIGPNLNYPQRVAADAAGAVYVAGDFEGVATFTGVTLTSRGSCDVYLAKYDAAGQLVWLRQAGGEGLDRVWGLAVDAGGNACITGDFAQDPSANYYIPNVMTIGSFRLNSEQNEVFVAKYDPAGQVLWARQTRYGPGAAPVKDATHGSDLALDPAGNVYVTGTVTGASAFDQVRVPAGGQFLAKYDARGIILWARTGLGDNGRFTEKVAVAATGEVYLGGFYSAPLTLAGTALTPLPNQPGSYLAQFNDQGIAQWVHPFTGTGLSGCAGLAVDGAGAVLVMTEFRGTATEDGQTFTSLGEHDVLTLKYSPQGRLLWGRQLGGNKDDYVVEPVVDGAGNVYVDVILRGMRTLTTPSGTDDVFNYLVSYSPAGNLRWNRPFATPYADGLAVGQVDEVWVAGSFHAPTQFDNFPLVPGSTYYANTFVVKLGVARLPPDSYPSTPVAVPNIITPNGDGRNDVFRLPGLPPGPWQLRIFSRWGQQVFASEDYQQDWAASGVADGLYFYRLQSPLHPTLQGWLEVLH